MILYLKERSESFFTVSLFLVTQRLMKSTKQREAFAAHSLHRKDPILMWILCLFPPLPSTFSLTSDKKILKATFSLRTYCLHK